MSTNIPALWSALLLVVGMPAAAAVRGDDLLGQWRPQDDPAAVVSVRVQDGAYQGRLTAHRDHPETVGTEILRGLHWSDPDGRWHGQVYSPRLKKVLDADAVPDGPDRFTLEVHVWFGTHRVVWQRLPND